MTHAKVRARCSSPAEDDLERKEEAAPLEQDDGDAGY